jgi:hypothetical protein
MILKWSDWYIRGNNIIIEKKNIRIKEPLSIRQLRRLEDYAERAKVVGWDYKHQGPIVEIDGKKKIMTRVGAFILPPNE